MAETAWERALRLRSQGLNAQYGLGASAPAATKPPTSWSPADVQASLAANPQATFGPSPQVEYTDVPAGMFSGGGSPFAGMAPSVRIPGYDPDYSALIAGDPGVISADADLSRFTGDLTAARRAAIRRAVIDAGLAPGTALADVDESTIAAAQANPQSIAADLAKQKERQSADLLAMLAGRGIVQSGGLAGGEQRVQEGYERGTSDLVRGLLDQISSYERDFTGKLADVTSQYRTLREQAALRIQMDPRFQPLGDEDAVLDPEVGLYMTPDGRWFDVNGNRVPPPVRGAVNRQPAAVAPAPAPAPPQYTPVTNTPIGPGPEAYIGPVYSQVGGQIVERPQGWIPLPGENLFT